MNMMRFGFNFIYCVHAQNYVDNGKLIFLSVGVCCAYYKPVRLCFLAFSFVEEIVEGNILRPQLKSRRTSRTT